MILNKVEVLFCLNTNLTLGNDLFMCSFKFYIHNIWRSPNYSPRTDLVTASAIVITVVTASAALDQFYTSPVQSVDTHLYSSGGAPLPPYSTLRHIIYPSLGMNMTALGLLYRDGDLHAPVSFRLPRNKGFDLWWARDTLCSMLRPLLWLPVQHRGSALTMGSHFTSIDELFTSSSTASSPTQNSHTLGPVGRTWYVSFYRSLKWYEVAFICKAISLSQAVTNQTNSGKLIVE